MNITPLSMNNPNNYSAAKLNNPTFKHVIQTRNSFLHNEKPELIMSRLNFDTDWGKMFTQLYDKSKQLFYVCCLTDVLDEIKYRNKISGVVLAARFNSQERIQPLPDRNLQLKMNRAFSHAYNEVEEQWANASDAEKQALLEMISNMDFEAEENAAKAPSTV